MDWVGKKVVVTGDRGFIGGALKQKLLEFGASVTGFDIKEGWDVRDWTQVCYILDEVKPDLVYHLAAQAFVPIANKNPISTFATNIMGTANVVDICTAHKIPCIVASSDKAYGAHLGGYKVETPLDAVNPYDVSKMCAEYICRTYRHRGGNIKVVRLCNVYGPGDTEPTRLIPHLISSYLHNRAPELRGSLSMLREWLYIDEAVDVYLSVANMPDITFLRGGIPLTVKQVIDVIQQKMDGKPAQISTNVVNDEIFDQFTALDYNHMDFGEGIDRTIAWWRMTDETTQNSSPGNR